MRYEFIEPFVSTTVRVLDSVIHSDIAKGGVSLVSNEEITGDIAIVITLRNSSEGNIILNMDTATALNLCSVMNGAGFDSLTPLGMDSIAELANMIAGNAASALNDMGFKFDVSTPVVVTKDRIRGERPFGEMFQIPLFTEFGEITMNVSMRTN
jgi:chemotaxis protein CheX